MVLLHGLTATQALRGDGLALARALGPPRPRLRRARPRTLSAGRADGDYGYARLAADIGAALDAAGIARACLAGASMGAQSAVRFALDRPQRVAGLVLVTPAFDPARSGSPQELAEWDALAAGLREGGVEGFLAAYPLERVADRMRETLVTVIRQRLSAHEHPLAVADALEAVPRSRPFESFEALAAISVPVTVVASRDEADPGHPLGVGEQWARAIPGAELVVEPLESPPRSPIAWQGGQLSRVIASVAADGRT